MIERTDAHHAKNFLRMNREAEQMKQQLSKIAGS